MKKGESFIIRSCYPSQR